MIDAYLKILDVALADDVIEYVNVKHPMNLVWAKLNIETGRIVMLDAIMFPFLIISVQS